MTAPPLQGLSNLMKLQGRFGDTELVHMTKPEVKGLASLGVLSTNPNTGLPEAFLGSIGGFFRDYVAPIAIGAISGPAAPYTVAGYQMAKTGAMGGSFIDAATAGMLSFAGGKLGKTIGEGLGGAIDSTTGAATDGLSNAANITQDIADNISYTGPIAGGSTGVIDSFSQAPIANLAGKGIAGGLKELGSAALDNITGTLKDPAKLGQAVGTAIGSNVADSMLQEKLQSQNIPQEVKDAEKVESTMSTGKLQDRRPQYQPGELSTSDIVGAMTGTAPALQFTDPQYSPATTGNISQLIGYSNGGGLEDALESITEGAEKIADMEGGQVYFEGMVKGDGDGMSDEIPFSIENKQPALLSRDEYVLPADVVSALGNGSSNAGADMLDKFMTDVREKTMGRDRQINQIG